MGLNPAYAPGATPLDPDELAALIPRHITTQGALNEWELQNIIEGAQWAQRRREADILTFEFMLELHRRMLGKTWRWAGTFRTSEKNIGVAPEMITVELRNLCDDIRDQFEYQTYPVSEIGARFHHRLVRIHLFANGNGRFAHMLTDLLIESHGGRSELPSAVQIPGHSPRSRDVRLRIRHCPAGLVIPGPSHLDTEGLSG